MDLDTAEGDSPQQPVGTDWEVCVCVGGGIEH